MTTNPRIVLSHTPATSPIVIGQSTVLTAGFLRDSASNVLTFANISRLIGLPITFNSAVRGSLSGAQTVIQANRTATVTFTSNAHKKSDRRYNGDANFNASPVSAAIQQTVSAANTTATITAHNPASTVYGQSYTLSANVTVNSSGGGTPTGAITISDGVNNCTITLPATSCTLPSNSVG